MAEQDNTGIPVAYLLLSTATSIVINKRITALEAFLKAIRDKYGFDPRFVLTDKDMAEIAAGTFIWPNAKHQLCWWHLKKAIRERMAKRKLGTTPYNPAKASKIFPFIDKKWKPKTKSDPNDVEGGRVKDPRDRDPNIAAPGAAFKSANAIPPIRIRVPPRPFQLVPDVSATMSTTDAAAANANVRTKNTVLTEMEGVDDEEETDVEEEVQDGPRMFCPEQHRKSIEGMVSRHLCAHPLIPGESAPTAPGIYEWAVKQMYTYCHSNGLVELWAYLWGNWYRPARWKIWARAEAAQIPRLKTTMICESQYVLFSF